MEPVQLIKEIPENRVVSRFLRRKYYPGSEYDRLTEKGIWPRIYKATRSKLRKPTTTITKDAITIHSGGFGGRQYYPKGHSKYDITLLFFDYLEEGKFKSYKECKREANERRYG